MTFKAGYFQYQDMYSDAEFKLGSDAIKRELELQFHGAVVVQSQWTRYKPVNKSKILHS